MALPIKYDPKITPQENFNNLLKDAGYPESRIADLKVIKGPKKIENDPNGRNTEIYFEVPADLAAKYDNQNQEDVTPQTEGNKVFKHRYKRLNLFNFIKMNSVLIDSEIGYEENKKIKGNIHTIKALGLDVFYPVVQFENIDGHDWDEYRYGDNPVDYIVIDDKCFDSTGGEFTGYPTITLKADATSGKQLLFKLTLNGQGDTSEYSVPKGTYDGADVAFAGKGNVIKHVPITLHDLLVLGNSVLNTKYNELAYEDVPHRKRFLQNKFAFTRVATVPQKTIFPEGLELSIPEGASGLIRYASPMAKYPEVHGNVNTYVLPLLAKEAADYCSKFLDTEEKFKFDKIDNQSNKNIVVFKTGKYNQETDLPKFEAFIGKMLNETGLERSDAPSTITYDGSVVIHKVFVDPSDDMFMSEPIYIALVPLEEKLTLKEGMDGFSALKLADEDTLPEM